MYKKKSCNPGFPRTDTKRQIIKMNEIVFSTYIRVPESRKELSATGWGFKVNLVNLKNLHFEKLKKWQNKSQILEKWFLCCLLYRIWCSLAEHLWNILFFYLLTWMTLLNTQFTISHERKIDFFCLLHAI